MDIPSIEPGLVTTRAEMQERFGGGVREGIVPSKKTLNILIYVDHDSGSKYGYEDGWLQEDDERGPVFEYTGRGAVGDQTFLGRAGSRNKAILEHADSDNPRSLRVFIALGKIPGSKSGAKQQRYVGEFELDTDQPYIIREAPGEDGQPRRIIVFRMRPKGLYQRLAKDSVTLAPTTDAKRVSAAVIASKLVEPNRTRAVESRRAAQPSVIADLRQNELRAQYLQYLESQGNDVFAFQIKISGTSIILKTDLYDATEHVLYSVRGASSREEVRKAMSQLKDYRRHVEPSNPRLAALLPEEPLEDLRDLLTCEGIDLVYPQGSGYLRVSAT